MLIVSKTYEIVTEESIENGEAAESGFVYTDRKMSFEEFIAEIQQGGFSVWSSSHPAKRDWLTTADPDIDFKTGNRTTNSLHFKNITDKQFEKLLKIVEKEKN